MIIRKQTKKTADGNRHRSEILSLVGPLFLWMILFLALPLIYVVVISFLEKGVYGGVQMIFTLENYTALWNPTYGRVIWRSIVLAFWTSLICLLISYPLFYPDSAKNTRAFACCLSCCLSGSTS